LRHTKRKGVGPSTIAVDVAADQVGGALQR
jgi:hypothetical protein